MFTTCWATCFCLQETKLKKTATHDYSLLSFFLQYQPTLFYGQLILQKCPLFGFIASVFSCLLALFRFDEQKQVLCERLVMLSSLFKVICTAEVWKDSEEEHAVRFPLRSSWNKSEFINLSFSQRIKPATFETLLLWLLCCSTTQLAAFLHTDIIRTKRKQIILIDYVL